MINLWGNHGEIKNVSITPSHQVRLIKTITQREIRVKILEVRIAFRVFLNFLNSYQQDL